MRLPEAEEAGVYQAADRWVQDCLLADGSLFTPHTPIWTADQLADLHGRFIDQPDESSDPFHAKLQKQLRGAPPATYQLMGEVLYVHLLIAHPHGVKGDTKREIIREVLEWSAEPVVVPTQLDSIFDTGVANPGQAFHRFRPFHLQLIIEMAEAWKRLEADGQKDLTADAWRFKAFLVDLQVKSSHSERLALLHLVHPDTFERIVSMGAKDRVAKAFAELVTDPVEDVDRRIAQIRKALGQEHGRDFDFYDAAILDRWQPDTSLWGQFVHWARRLSGLPGWEEDEVTYKLTSADQASAARSAFLEGGDWRNEVATALSQNQQLTPWQLDDRFSKWVDGEPDAAADALGALWTEGASLDARVDGFLDVVPRAVTGGPGLGLAMASFLLMGVDPRLYPIYRHDPFRKGFDLTGFGRPAKDSTAAGVYQHALQFLDQIAEEAASRGLEFADRLASQGALWSVTKTPVEHFDLPPDEANALRRYRGGEIPSSEIPEGPTPTSLLELADELLLDGAYLGRILRLLGDRKQVIFHGPPGTGKTFVAQKLAAHIAGEDGQVQLVQFHPAYAYEDFIEGYRPALLESGAAGFKLRPGPLKRLAESAASSPEATHVLIIDEVNRGNVAKVFGELYFLLEYRRRDVTLQYSDEAFSLPENLWIIGTMNTADRSIALVDAALRRRFHFVPFFPSEPPIQGLLQRWLAAHKPDLAWVADIVDAANDRLADRHMAVGPSHFLRGDLDEGWVSLIWEHSVLPYIAEQFFGEEERVQEFRLEALRSGSGGSVSGERPDEGTDAAPDAE